MPGKTIAGILNDDKNFNDSDDLKWVIMNLNFLSSSSTVIVLYCIIYSLSLKLIVYMYANLVILAASITYS